VRGVGWIKTGLEQDGANPVMVQQAAGSIENGEFIPLGIDLEQIDVCNLSAGGEFVERRDSDGLYPPAWVRGRAGGGFRVWVCESGWSTMDTSPVWLPRANWWHATLGQARARSVSTAKLSWTGSNERIRAAGKLREKCPAVSPR